MAAELVVSVAIACLAIEALALALLGRRVDFPLSLSRCAGSLLAGLFLLLALAAALGDANDAAVVACLTAAFAAHLADLYSRRRERGHSMPTFPR